MNGWVKLMLRVLLLISVVVGNMDIQSRVKMTKINIQLYICNLAGLNLIESLKKKVFYACVCMGQYVLYFVENIYLLKVLYSYVIYLPKYIQ